MLTQLNRLLRRLAIAVEFVVGFLLSLPWRLLFWRKKAVEIKIFNAIRHPGGIHIRGRTLTEKKLPAPRADDRRWTNFRRIFSQFITAEAPRTAIEIELAGRTHRLHSNREGYFQLELPESSDQQLTARLPKSGWQKDFPLTGEHQNQQRIIITDIDDTLIETGATAIHTMVASTLFGNALTRQLVDGMPALLRALSRSQSTPVYALTSSPWNLEAFIKAIFERMQLRLDGIFMTDWGLTVDQWIHPNHWQHKLHSIRRILRWHPNSSALLFGDDSQADPEVYTQIAEEFPGRVSAIFIRPVSTRARRNEVTRRLQDCAERLGIVARCGMRPKEIQELLEDDPELHD